MFAQRFEKLLVPAIIQRKTVGIHIRIGTDTRKRVSPSSHV